MRELAGVEVDMLDTVSTAAPDDRDAEPLGEAGLVIHAPSRNPDGAIAVMDNATGEVCHEEPRTPDLGNDLVMIHE